MGETTKESNPDALPLVSVMIINWNYSAYIGRTIESVKQQDYHNLEVLIVDNGSTDRSQQIISKHIADDKRFRLVSLAKNLGQLGAFFYVYNQLQGEFVVSLDADDVLFPNFIAMHVQAHLALGEAVALTSSDVTIIGKEGEVLIHGYRGRNRHQPDGTGLTSSNKTVHLPQVGKQAYQQLHDTISTHHGPVGWIWGPGTSNMYRRSVLDNIYERPKQRAWMRSSDNFLNPLCHALVGTALIDQELSAYRVHGTNYYGTVQVSGGGRIDKAARMRQSNDFYETTDSLLRRAKHYAPLLGDKYWDVLESVSKFIAGPSGKITPGSPDTLALIERNYDLLCAVFTKDVVQQRLPTFFIPGDIYLAIRHIGGSMTAASRSAFSGQGMSPHHTVSPRLPIIVRKPEPQSVTPGDYEDVYGYGPASVLSADPPVFLTGIALKEFIGIASAFGRRYGNISAAFIIYPTWTLTPKDRVQSVVQAALRHKLMYPAHQLIFICNELAEVKLLQAGGLTAYLLNKNFMVPEHIFKPLPGNAVTFDAVYNARFAPGKRHELARNIPKVAYISYGEPDKSSDQAYQNIMIETLQKAPEHRLINSVAHDRPIRISAERVNRALNQVAVGLCLSEAEGSNWASMEYLLAGLPVVSTPNIGGRDQYFDPEYCIVCDPTPAAVRDAVAELKARAIPRNYIRERTLAKIAPQRQRFLKLIDHTSENLGGSRRYDNGRWPYTSLDDLIIWQAHTDLLRSFEQNNRPDLRPGGIKVPDSSRMVATIPGLQLQSSELQPIIDAIESRPECRLLVFGCGNDSVFWEAINPYGDTVFLEDNPELIRKTQPKLKTARIYAVVYGTNLSGWRLLLDNPKKLQLELPDELSDQKFDVILVDTLASYAHLNTKPGNEDPGRMKSIYAASQLVAPRGYVFVRDCDREMEQCYAERYLSNERLFVKARSTSMLQGYLF